MRFAMWLIILVLGGSAQAQMSAYGMAARVNGVGISNEKLERSFQEYMGESGQNIAAIRYPGRVKVLRREALELLIEQELVWQAAQKKGVVATPEEVTQTVDKMRAGFRSSDAFVTRLAIEGYTEESYREHMKRLVSAQKYLDNLTSGVEVSDAEVHDFYAENTDKFRQVPEEDVRDRIREHLVTLKRKQVAEETIKDLRSKADIEILMPL
jgi:hypothetical protein